MASADHESTSETNPGDLSRDIFKQPIKGAFTMSNLTIKDLAFNHELDQAAASLISGGINEWINIPLRSRPLSPLSIMSYNIQVTNNTYNTYVDNDYTLIQPQIFNVGNGVENSGSMSYNVSPQFVSALSPVNVQS
jgi:hypothetical protein